MDKMNGWAKQCSVTVYVTKAFRHEGQEIGGTVVPPATNSNHPAWGTHLNDLLNKSISLLLVIYPYTVGHSITFNLDTPRGWCNCDCLRADMNSYAKCFTDKVRFSILKIRFLNDIRLR